MQRLEPHVLRLDLCRSWGRPLLGGVGVVGVLEVQGSGFVHCSLLLAGLSRLDRCREFFAQRVHQVALLKAVPAGKFQELRGGF